MVTNQSGSGLPSTISHNHNSINVPTNTTATSSSGNSSDFVRKLYKMLEDPSYSSIVRWGDDNDSFVVLECERFTKSILPKHFKHSNFASFVRQLNKYDFHKVRQNSEENGQSPYGANAWEFKHPEFKANNKDSLDNIRRKAPAPRKPPPGADDSVPSQQLDSLAQQFASQSQQLHNLSERFTQFSVDHYSLIQEVQRVQRNVMGHHQVIHFMMTYLHSLDSHQKPANANVAAAAAAAAAAGGYPSDITPPVDDAPDSRPLVQAQKILAELSSENAANLQNIDGMNAAASAAAAAAAAAATAAGVVPAGHHDINRMPGQGSIASGMDHSASHPLAPPHPHSRQGSFVRQMASNSGPMTPYSIPPHSSQTQQQHHQQHQHQHQHQHQPQIKTDNTYDIVYHDSAVQNPNALNGMGAQNAAAAAAAAGNMYNEPGNGLATYQMHNVPPAGPGSGTSSLGPSASNPASNGAMLNDSLGDMSTPNAQQTPMSMGSNSSGPGRRQMSFHHRPHSYSQGMPHSQMMQHQQQQQQAQAQAQAQQAQAQQQSQSFSTNQKKGVPKDSGWHRVPQILLVEDDTTCRQIGQKFLRSFSCNVDTAFDGLEAVNKLQNGCKYDLILMDIIMPVLDGISACSMIRRMPDPTPIIAMTSNIRQTDIELYFNIGMNDVLPKPFAKETLSTTLRKHLTHLSTENAGTNPQNGMRQSISSVAGDGNGQHDHRMMGNAAVNPTDLAGSGQPNGNSVAMGMGNLPTALNGLSNPNPNNISGLSNNLGPSAVTVPMGVGISNNFLNGVSNNGMAMPSSLALSGNQTAFPSATKVEGHDSYATMKPAYPVSMNAAPATQISGQQRQQAGTMPVAGLNTSAGTSGAPESGNGSGNGSGSGSGNGNGNGNGNLNAGADLPRVVCGVHLDAPRTSNADATSLSRSGSGEVGGSGTGSAPGARTRAESGPSSVAVAGPAGGTGGPGVSADTTSNTIDAVTDGAVSARGQVLASTPNSAQGSLTPSMSGRRRRADEMDSAPAGRETTAADGQPSNMDPPPIVPTASMSPAVPVSSAGSAVNFHGSSSAPPAASTLPSTSAHVGGYARPHAHSVSNASPALTPSSNSNGMNNDIYPAKRQRMYSVGQASFQQPGLSSGHMHGARHSSISAGSHPIAQSGSTSQLGTPMGLVSVMSAPPAGMTAMSGGMNPAMNVPMDISTVGVGGIGLSSNGPSGRARSSGNNVLNPMHTGQMS